MANADVEMSGLTSGDESREKQPIKKKKPPMCARCQQETAVPRRRAAPKGTRTMTAAQEASLKRCQDAKAAQVEMGKLEKALARLKVAQILRTLTDSEQQEEARIAARVKELAPILEETRERKKKRQEQMARRKSTMTVICEEEELRHVDRASAPEDEDEDGHDSQLDAMFSVLHHGDADDDDDDSGKDSKESFDLTQRHEANQLEALQYESNMPSSPCQEEQLPQQEPPPKKMRGMKRAYNKISRVTFKP